MPPFGMAPRSVLVTPAELVQRSPQPPSTPIAQRARSASVEQSPQAAHTAPATGGNEATLTALAREFAEVGQYEAAGSAAAQALRLNPADLTARAVLKYVRGAYIGATVGHLTGSPRSPRARKPSSLNRYGRYASERVRSERPWRPSPRSSIRGGGAAQSRHDMDQSAEEFSWMRSMALDAEADQAWADMGQRQRDEGNEQAEWLADAVASRVVEQLRSTGVGAAAHASAGPVGVSQTEAALAKGKLQGAADKELREAAQAKSAAEVEEAEAQVAEANAKKEQAEADEAARLANIEEAEAQAAEDDANREEAEVSELIICCHSA
jgi:hypothetical protein